MIDSVNNIAIVLERGECSKLGLLGEKLIKNRLLFYDEMLSALENIGI